ncbi:MAG: caspase family protein [Candidatus Competibacteraceae bacterium]|nr:caspase family protein [Candidatus Competibacteraceae bacterium]
MLSELGSKWLPRLAHPDDLVVIFISSHGSASEMDVGGVNYLVVHDTDPDDLFTTGIDMQQLTRLIKSRVHCQRIVIILDACHSGAHGQRKRSQPHRQYRRPGNSHGHRSTGDCLQRAQPIILGIQGQSQRCLHRLPLERPQSPGQDQPGQSLQ